MMHNRTSLREKTAYAKPALRAYGSVRNLTGGSLVHGHDTLGPSGKNPASDRRYKENIVEVGAHPAGFSLYLFDYKPEFREFGEGRQFGVMADEVEPIFPEAVFRDEAGYASVDYRRLGITQH